MTYRDRRIARAERLRGWADKRRQKSGAAFTAAHHALDGIEPGQPILVGHHSERRHRAALERHDGAMRRGFESQNKAADMSSRAAGIDHQLDTSIYNDDPDALERLTEKLARLEAERERVKVVNRAVRKHGITSDVLTDAERAELLAIDRVAAYQQPLTKGFPAYHLSNLGGVITRTRQRIAYLSGQTGVQTAAAPAEGQTVTARAGLAVAAGMTTPSRPGKAPRPVWTVRGNIGLYRSLLIRLGGNFYHGAFSFWDDPTDALERALSETVAS